MGEALTTWGVWLIALIAAAVVIRGTVHFDVNEWLKERRKQRKENLRSLCPHVVQGMEDGHQVIRPTHSSPLGTVSWQCQLCGDISHDAELLRGHVAYWERHPQELSERIEKINKIAKKLNRQ